MDVIDFEEMKRLRDQAAKTADPIDLYNITERLINIMYAMSEHIIDAKEELTELQSQITTLNARLTKLALMITEERE